MYDSPNVVFHCFTHLSGWVYTQAVFLLLAHAREAALVGAAHRGAVYAMLCHVTSATYAADGGAGFFDRVRDRAAVLVEGVDTPPTLAAAAAAVDELAAWRAALEAEDAAACLQRAVATGADDYVIEGTVDAALRLQAPAAAAAPLAGGCRAAAAAGPLRLEVRVQLPADGAEPLAQWGGAAALLPGAEGGSGGMPEPGAEAVADAVTRGLTDRLAPWLGAGETGFEAVAAPVEADGGGDGHCVAVTWCVDAAAVAAAATAAAPAAAVEECFDAVVTSAADLLRCALLATKEYDHTTPLSRRPQACAGAQLCSSRWACLLQMHCPRLCSACTRVCECVL